MSRVHKVAVALSLVLPVLILAGWAGQAGWAVRNGVVVRFPITGYDPRDPLRGHFLRYRFAWNWQGEAPVGHVPAICVLSRTAENPLVRPLADGDRTCTLPLRLGAGSNAALTPAGVSTDLFIPEDKAKALQSALTTGSAKLTVDLVINADGMAHIKDWHIDGKTAAEWPAR